MKIVKNCKIERAKSKKRKKSRKSRKSRKSNELKQHVKKQSKPLIA